jgi:hypothetical protein
MMVETRGTPWTPIEDNLFRKMAEANIDPEIIAAKLNRSVRNIKTRAYAIGLPLKWFKLKANEARPRPSGRPWTPRRMRSFQRC